MKYLHPRAVLLFFIRSIYSLFWVFVFLGGLAWIIFWGELDVNLLMILVSIPFLWWIGIVFLSMFVLILMFFWARLSYHYYRYDITDRGFTSEQGVISKRYVTIPYGRIQNINMYRDLESRILGLASLSIQTAGESGAIIAEGYVQGLSSTVAEQLREELLARAYQARIEQSRI